MWLTTLYTSIENFNLSSNKLPQFTQCEIDDVNRPTTGKEFNSQSKNLSKKKSPRQHDLARELKQMFK
jgi:hypothetical protein